MFFFNTLIILILFLVIGYLVGHEEGKLVFLKAIAIGALLVFLSYITILMGSFIVWFPTVLFFWIFGESVSNRPYDDVIKWHYSIYLFKIYEP